MKVTISCGGKWCTFYQAEQLYRRGVLDKIITGYPLFKLNEERKKIPEEKITSIPIPQIGSKILRQIPMVNALPVEYWASINFDRLASRKIDRCEIFSGWASYSLDSMRMAKAYGALTFLERGSAHIEHQKELVEEEYQKWGMKKNFVDPWTVERSLKEYEEADCIVLQSEFAFLSFISKGFRQDKLLKIPLGVDLKNFNQVPKKDKVFRIIYVGSLTLRKGLPYLLEAMRKISSHNVELLLIGGVSDEIKPFLKDYDGRFSYLGKISHDELYHYYSQSSVFVLPSIEDGFGQVIPEAMACGLPVIATENTCGPDLLRDEIDGFVIPIRNTEALAEKIMTLHDNEELRRAMGLSAKKRVHEFTWERWSEEALKCYRKLLSKSDSNSS